MIIVFYRSNLFLLKTNKNLILLEHKLPRTECLSFTKILSPIIQSFSKRNLLKNFGLVTFWFSVHMRFLAHPVVDVATTINSLMQSFKVVYSRHRVVAIIIDFEKRPEARNSIRTLQVFFRKGNQNLKCSVATVKILV